MTTPLTHESLAESSVTGVPRDGTAVLERARVRSGLQGRGVAFAAGWSLGWVVAPFFGLVSFLRRARTFHPSGLVLAADVRAEEDVPAELRDVADRLAGRALVRFSGALWKHAANVPDVLGCAVRFRANGGEEGGPGGAHAASGEVSAAEDGEQDLLFATIVRPWTMLLAPFTTNVRDYLANAYYAVSPFDIGLDTPVYFRLQPLHPSTNLDGTRSDRLTQEVERGGASLTVGVSPSPFGPWAPIARVELLHVATVDQQALRFDPFHDGQAIRPSGFVHALRAGVYAVSQRARPRTSHS